MNPGLDIARVAANVVEREPGLWVPRTTAGTVSYPETGHLVAKQVEAESFWYQHRRDCVLAAVRRHPPPGATLDIGGGTGFLAMALTRAGFPTGVVEPGEHGARAAWERGVRPVVNATTTNAGFRGGSVPAAGLFDVVEHVKDDVAFLSHVHDLLRDDGRLYVTVPAHAWLWSVDDIRAGHFRRYTIDTICRAITSAGLSVVHATAFFRPLPLPILLLRSVPSRLGWRQADDVARATNEHRMGGKLAAVRDAVLAPEVAAISAGRRMRFGSSILVVADATR